MNLHRSTTLTASCPICDLHLQWLRADGRYAGLKAHLSYLHPGANHQDVIDRLERRPLTVSGPTTGPVAVD